MTWLEEVLDSLAASPVCGYLRQGPAASEPTALAALALFGHGRQGPAGKAAAWLAEQQAADGSVGICEGQTTPAWPTSLAILAWVAGKGMQKQIDRATQWTLGFQGIPLPRTEDLGHDTTLIAWPWCEGTHSWMEPTALFVLALKASGRGSHARTREAVRLITDRQLATGGCNYGNTIVLGQTLRPHVQPTGIALLALAGERESANKARLSLRYLRGALAAETTTASLSWGLLGLAAHGQTPLEAPAWLEQACGRTRGGDNSPYKLALLALAALADRSPLVALPNRTTVP